MEFKVGLNRSFKLLVLGGLLSFSACSHLRGVHEASDVSDNLPIPKTLTEVLQQDLHSNSLDKKVQPGSGSSQAILIQNGEITVQGKKLDHTQFDFPITVNARVEHWIDYFCGRGRPYFEKYLARSEYFIPFIEPLLRKHGMPEDLVYLAMIESGFNNLARSRAKAVGPWQFISATGKRYGLRVNGWIDERRDIQKSTLAAVEYLKDLYQMFQSWELAAAAYNAGEAKVARAIRRFGTKDFWMIARQRFLRPETRDYVPKIIAAAIISKNRVQFGFPDQKSRPGLGEVVAGDGEVVKVVKTDKPVEDKEYIREKEADMQVGLADDLAFSDDEESGASQVKSMDLIESNQAGWMAESEISPSSEAGSAPLAKPIPTPHVTRSGEVGGEHLDIFEVKSPADLLQVAKAAGLSYQTVKSLNPEILRWCTPPTLPTYSIKLPASTKDRFLSTYNHEAFPRKVQFMTYKVRRGETLLRIARHFGIKVDLVSDLNRVSPRMPLRNGARILLPIPSDRTRTFASLDIVDPPERRRSRRHRRQGYRHFRLNYKHREASRGISEGSPGQKS